MAKYESKFMGNFDEFLKVLDRGIVSGSLSAKFEDGSDTKMGDVRCAVRVYERFSLMGGNRVSLNVTLLGNDEGKLLLSAITAGGSQAVFFKINTIGEHTFLDCLVKIVEDYKRKYNS